MSTTTKPTVALATNSDDFALELRAVERFAGGHGFRSEMFVRCHGFAAQRPFYFSERSFEDAMKALQRMDKQLQGEARLEEDYEHDQFLQFKMDTRGHVLVSGQLVLLSDHPNCLSFSFQTDQTCLASLIRSLNAFNQ